MYSAIGEGFNEYSKITISDHENFPSSFRDMVISVSERVLSAPDDPYSSSYGNSSSPPEALLAYEKKLMDDLEKGDEKAAEILPWVMLYAYVAVSYMNEVTYSGVSEIKERRERISFLLREVLKNSDSVSADDLGRLSQVAAQCLSENKAESRPSLQVFSSSMSAAFMEKKIGARSVNESAPRKRM